MTTAGPLQALLGRAFQDPVHAVGLVPHGVVPTDVSLYIANFFPRSDHGVHWTSAKKAPRCVALLSPFVSGSQPVAPPAPRLEAEPFGRSDDLFEWSDDGEAPVPDGDPSSAALPCTTECLCQKSIPALVEALKILPALCSADASEWRPSRDERNGSGRSVGSSPQAAEYRIRRLSPLQESFSARCVFVRLRYLSVFASLRFHTLPDTASFVAVIAAVFGDQSLHGRCDEAAHVSSRSADPTLEPVLIHNVDSVSLAPPSKASPPGASRFLQDPAIAAAFHRSLTSLDLSDSDLDPKFFGAQLPRLRCLSFHGNLTLVTQTVMMHSIRSSAGIDLSRIETLHCAGRINWLVSGASSFQATSTHALRTVSESGPCLPGLSKEETALLLERCMPPLSSVGDAVQRHLSAGQIPGAGPMNDPWTQVLGLAVPLCASNGAAGLVADIRSGRFDLGTSVMPPEVAFSCSFMAAFAANTVVDVPRPPSIFPALTTLTLTKFQSLSYATVLAFFVSGDVLPSLRHLSLTADSMFYTHTDHLSPTVAEAQRCLKAMCAAHVDVGIVGSDSPPSTGFATPARLHTLHLGNVKVPPLMDSSIAHDMMAAVDDCAASGGFSIPSDLRALLLGAKAAWPLFLLLDRSSLPYDRISVLGGPRDVDSVTEALALAARLRSCIPCLTI